nr:MAG TPA: hypothetical protein [Caudoviricetes sp.]
MRHPFLLHTWCSSKFLLIDFLQSLCACGTQPVFPVAIFLPQPFFICKIFTASVFCVPSVQIVQHFLPLCSFWCILPEMLPSIFTRHATDWLTIEIEEIFMLLQNRAIWNIDLPRDGFSLESLICDIVHIRTSYTKTGSKAKRIVCVVAGHSAASSHTHETCGIVSTRGTETPKNDCACRAVLVFDLAVSGTVIRILCLLALFVRISVCNFSEYFVFRQQKEIVRCRRHRACGAAVTCVVRVLRHRFQHRAERCRNDRNDRTGIV